jgi:hypothetical protein
MLVKFFRSPRLPVQPFRVPLLGEAERCVHKDFLELARGGQFSGHSPFRSEWGDNHFPELPGALADSDEDVRDAAVAALARMKQTKK